MPKKFYKSSGNFNAHLKLYGTNFVGASNELLQEVKRFDYGRMHDELSDRGIECLDSTQTPNVDDRPPCGQKQCWIAQQLKDRFWRKCVLEYLQSFAIMCDVNGLRSVCRLL